MSEHEQGEATSVIKAIVDSFGGTVTISRDFVTREYFAIHRAHGRITPTSGATLLEALNRLAEAVDRKVRAEVEHRASEVWNAETLLATCADLDLYFRLHFARNDSIPAWVARLYRHGGGYVWSGAGQQPEEAVESLLDHVKREPWRIDPEAHINARIAARYASSTPHEAGHAPNARQGDDRAPERKD